MENPLDLLPNETLAQNAVFNHYLELGEKRTFIALARKFKKSVQTIYLWNERFKWQDRIAYREAEISRRYENALDDSIVSSKLKFRAKIKGNLDTLEKMMDDIIKKNKKTGKSTLDIKIKNVSDLKKVTDCKVSLVKLDLLLAGENTEKIGNEEIYVVLEP